MNFANFTISRLFIFLGEKLEKNKSLDYAVSLVVLAYFVYSFGYQIGKFVAHFTN